MASTSTEELMEALVKDPEFMDQFKSWDDVMAFLEVAMTEGIAIPVDRNGVDSGSKSGGQGKIPDGLISAMNKPGQKPFSYGLAGADLQQQLQGMKERRRQALQEMKARPKVSQQAEVTSEKPILHGPVAARPAPATITSSKNTASTPLPAGAINRAHAKYNSPMSVYSKENIADAYVAQAGGAQERSKKEAESEVAKFIRESESGKLKPGHPTGDDGEYRGGSNKQSMSFRVLQRMTDTDKSEEDTEAQRRRREKDPEFRHNAEDDEMRFTGLNRGKGIPSKSFSRLQQLTIEDDEANKRTGQFLSPNGTENDEEVGKYDETSIRYKGKHIPSPAFRVLQNWAELDPMDVKPDSERVPDRRDNEDVQREDEVPLEKRYTGGNIPSRVFRTLQAAVGDDSSDHDSTGKPQVKSDSQGPRSIRVIQKPTESAGATDF